MWGNLESKSVVLKADGKEIRVGFTRSGTDHAARDAMFNLSGKYMSQKSMINIDEILKSSVYVEKQTFKEPRKDKKEFFFAHTDTQGRQLFLKVAFDRATNKKGRYYLYTVTDVLK